MANKKAIASGLWSSMSTWDGGTLPGPTDDVYANTFTVTVDQDVIANTLRTTSGTGITAGGGFVIASGANITTTVTAGINAASHSGVDATSILTIDVPCMVNLIADCTGGSSTARRAVRINHSSAIVNANGNVAGGSTASCSGITLDAGTLTIPSGKTITAGATSTGRRGVEVFGGNATIDAAVSGAGEAGNSAANTAAVYSSGGAVIVNGPVLGDAAAASRSSVFASSGGNVVINGSVTGGTASTVETVTGFSGGVIVINGLLIAGDGAAATPVEGLDLQIRGPILQSAKAAIRTTGGLSIYGSAEVMPFSLADVAAVTGAQIAAATSG